MNDRELEILNRGRSWAYRWQAVYGKESLYIPLERLREITEKNFGENQSLASVFLSTDGSEHGYVFTTENPALNNYRSFILN